MVQTLTRSPLGVCYSPVPPYPPPNPSPQSPYTIAPAWIAADRLSTATITQLQIAGIRAFDPENPQTISFQSPLTLIVGTNGSGKTTIIECLKFATTGKLPPNSGQGAFIHDPSIGGNTHVSAQVKIKFYNANRDLYTVNRNLNCSMSKAGKKSMKTVEGSMVLKSRNGERTTVSTRVVQLDKSVPQFLGVSPAILDNVIFCHQDESLWPLGTPLELKNKFDLIFDAMKYTLAVDDLRAMKKRYTSDLKEITIHEANFKASKNKGEKLKKRILDTHDEVEVMRQQVAQLDEESNDMHAIVNEKKQQAQEALGYKNKLEKHVNDAGYLKRQVDDLEKRLKEHGGELDDSDDWLASTLAQYNDRMAAYVKEEEGLRGEQLRLGKTLSDSRRELSQKQAERGRQLALKTAYEDKLQAQAKMVKVAAGQHEIRGYDGDLNENQVQDFMTKLRKLSRDKDRELERVKKAIEDEVQLAREVVSNLERDGSRLEQEKSNAKKMINENNKQGDRIQGELRFIKIDEGGKAALDASLKSSQDQLQRSMEEFDVAQWDQKLKTEQSRLQDLYSEDERLRRELAKCTKLANERASLEHVLNELKKAQSSLDTMFSTYGDQLNSVIGLGWEVDTLEREYQAAVDRRARIVSDATKQRDSTKQDLNQVDFKLAELRKRLGSKTATKKAYEADILKSVTDVEGMPIKGVDDYEETLKELEVERNDIQRSFDGSGFINDYYNDTCLPDINDNNKCSLCQRKFADQKERSSALARLNKMIAENARATIEAALKEVEGRHNAAVAVQSKFISLKALVDVEIPSIEMEIEEGNRKKMVLVRDLEKHDTLVNEEISAKRDIDGLSKTISKITNDASQISERQAESGRISSQQSLSGNILSSEELNEQSDACNQKIRALAANIKKFSDDKELARSNLSSLELEISTASRRCDDARNELEKKKSLLNQLEKCRNDILQYREDLQQADTDLAALDPQMATATSKFVKAKKDGEARERSVQSDKDELNNTVNRFNMVESDINTYIDNRGPQRLEASQRAIDDLEEAQARIEADMVSVKSKADELRNLVSDSKATKTAIEDTIRFRKSKRDLLAVQKSIAELEERNVSGNFERLSREAMKAEKQHHALMAKRQPLVVVMHEKDKQIEVGQKEWDTDYRDAADMFRKSHIELETTKAAIQDIDKYRIALDQAIMRFHSIKMEEINRIAADLWRDTYQGTDIDRIMIQADPDTAETAAGKRNYNYRLVMVKEEIEMDMRGRCSAGQKVLASIVVRLALAEVFGVGCGIIALDEPTTNLDKQTIKSLADSLHGIIKVRKGQSNFQLIVITHDEEFLSAMKCQEFTDVYYHVSRDSRQKSIIMEQSIGELLNG